VNTIYSLLYNGLAGVRTDLTTFTAKQSDPQGLVNTINSVFFHSGASAPLLNSAVTAARAASTPAHGVLSALYVMLTSSEYQVIH